MREEERRVDAQEEKKKVMMREVTRVAVMAAIWAEMQLEMIEEAAVKVMEKSLSKVTDMQFFCSCCGALVPLYQSL